MLKEATVVVPSVTVGNVPQLAVDILVSSLPMQLVGRVHHIDLLPLCGGRPDGEGLVTALEVYYSEEHKMVCLQQRSPVRQGSWNRFYHDLVHALISAGASRFLALVSCEPRYQLDRALETASRLVYTPTLAAKREPCFEGLYLIDVLCEQEAQCRALGLYASEGDNAQDGMMLADAVGSIEHVSNVKWVRPASWAGCFGDDSQERMLLI